VSQTVNLFSALGPTTGFVYHKPIAQLLLDAAEIGLSKMFWVLAGGEERQYGFQDPGF
jgi:hypothetical protein